MFAFNSHRSVDFTFMFDFGSSTKSDGKMKRRKELDLKGEGLLTFLTFQ